MTRACVCGGRVSVRCLDLVERLRQIGQQVLDVLDAARQAHERVIDTESRSLVGRHRGVRHDGRVLDEALDTAETLGQQPELDGLEEGARLGETALEPDSDHAAEAGGLLLGELVLRMAREARVAHALDLGMRLEEGRNLLGVLLVALHAQVQGLGAAHGHVRVERAGDGAHAVLDELETAEQLLVVQRNDAHDLDRAACVSSLDGKQAGWLAATAARTTSEWPFRYLETECSEMSAPSSSGR